MPGRSWTSSARKRAIDIVGAGAGLVVLSPLIAVVAVTVRWRLGAPVLFRQRRAGLDGAELLVPKLRTMTDDRAADGELLPDAERLTPFGVRLRAASLDELPQLWLVVKGGMSLVGPRPLPVAYVERYGAEQRRRLGAKPGLTGWAQIKGRNALSWPEKLALDVWYVDNASLWLDVRILARTVWSVIGRAGVSADGHATMAEFMGEAEPRPAAGRQPD